LRESILLSPFFCLGTARLALQVIQRISDGLSHALAWLSSAALSCWSRDQAPVFSARALRAHHLALATSGLALALYWVLLIPLRADLSKHVNALDYIAVSDVQHLSQACSYLSSHTKATDVVLASPVTSDLGCQSFSPMQFAAAQGARGNPFFPESFLNSRLRLHYGLDEVKFVLLNDFTLKVESSFPGVGTLLEQVRDWPVDLSAGSVQVLRNPKLPKPGQK